MPKTKYESNPERIAYKREYNKIYRAKEKGHIAQLMRRWCKKNSEYVKAYRRATGKAYREKTKLRMSEYQTVYRRENRERLLAEKRKYYLGHRSDHLYRLRLKLYKANRYSNQKKLTLTEVQGLYEQNIKTHGTLTCYLCLKRIKFGQDSLDHKRPFCRGGENTTENIGICHIKCNFEKKYQTYEEYKKWAC